MSTEPADVALTRLSVDQVATLLQRAGARSMSADRVRSDLAAGAPVNEDGTISLIAYGAWMLRDLSRREGRREP
jgi:hypothetical protein